MLEHRHQIAASTGLLYGDPIFSENMVHISYLPMAHSFEESVFVAILLLGASIGYYSGDPLKLLDDMQTLKPTIFISVPRLFSRIYDKVMAGVKDKSTFQ